MCWKTEGPYLCLLQQEYKPKIEDDAKSEDDPKNKDDPKNEDNPKNRVIPSTQYFELSAQYLIPIIQCHIDVIQLQA